MKKCAFLSMDSLPGFSEHDLPLIEPLRSKNWEVDHVSWNDKTSDWNDYELVIIRSTWDYLDHPKEFTGALSKIDASRAILANSINLIKWNIRKTYLRELENQGVPVVPTTWLHSINCEGIEQCFEHFDSDELVVKPQYGLNGFGTYRCTSGSLSDTYIEMSEELGSRAVMVQPLMRDILSEGEYSTYYFNGDYSHAVHKIPKPGDFRVQEKFGGKFKAIKPSKEMLEISNFLFSRLPELPLYARVDLVPDKGDLCLMELELIEPTLAFDLAPEAVWNFVEAVEKIAKTTDRSV